MGILSAVLFFFIPSIASAHEVYVLPREVINAAIATPAFSSWQTMLANVDLFMLWAFIGALVVFIVFFASISRVFERWLDPLLAKLTPYAPVVSRITIGLSFLAAAYYGALFGPELPLALDFGATTPWITGILAVLGVLIIVGAYTRLAALIALGLFGYAISLHGTYMLTYTNYAGELLVLLILGAYKTAVHHRGHDVRRMPRWVTRIREWWARYAFLILRVAFGISLLYASLYAKVIHNNLALAVADAYPSLVAFFGFEPHFLVLGAAIIEIVIGLFFILGIEIRFTSLFLLFWLSLSLWYFGEVVWPHVILIGIPIAFIFYGYDPYSLEGRFFKKCGREPVL